MHAQLQPPELRLFYLFLGIFLPFLGDVKMSPSDHGIQSASIMAPEIKSLSHLSFSGFSWSLSISNKILTAGDHNPKVSPPPVP